MIANIYRAEGVDPFVPADFMPGAKTERDSLIEFAEAVLRGETFDDDPDPAEREKVRRELNKHFSNVR